MAVLDHKCPNCAAVLKFNPTTQNFICEFCKGEFTLDELKNYEEEHNDKLQEKEVVVEKDNNGMKVYKCNNCGANIVMSPNTSATSCIYCKNTAIIQDNLIGEFSPSMVIPFKKTKEEAIDAFIKIGKGKPLMPKEFSDKKNIEEMSGIYIPFWTFDFNANANATYDASRIKSWVAGNYSYTKTDKYLVDISGNLDFSRVPVDGSKRFQDDIMNSIEPFEYKDLIKFDYSYLSGFLAEKYDVDSSEALKIANSRAENSSKEELRKEVSKTGYTSIIKLSNNVEIKLDKEEYILLPVWMLNIKYKDKIYTFAMNGQTGKLIGDIPVDKKKAVIFAALIFAASLIVLIIINVIIRMCK